MSTSNAIQPRAETAAPAYRMTGGGRLPNSHSGCTVNGTERSDGDAYDEGDCKWRHHQRPTVVRVVSRRRRAQLIGIREPVEVKPIVYLDSVRTATVADGHVHALWVVVASFVATEHLATAVTQLRDTAAERRMST